MKELKNNFGDIEGIKNTILKFCGMGSILNIGCGEGVLVRKLLSLGIDAYGIDCDTTSIQYCQSLNDKRYKNASIYEIPWEDEKFELVIWTNLGLEICWENIKSAIGELYRVVNKTVIIVLNQEWDREEIEKVFFESGFRKHPLYLKNNSFESLENYIDGLTLVFEKRRNNDMITTLTKNDMLLRSDRISDIILAVYTKTLEYIRPHDKVIDLSCRTGFGSAILWEGSNSSLVEGIDLSVDNINYANYNYLPNRKTLHFVHINDESELLQMYEPHSRDVLICINIDNSFGTKEKLDQFFIFAHKVLRPGGRLIVSFSNHQGNQFLINLFKEHFHFLTEKLLGISKNPRRWLDTEQKALESADYIFIVSLCDPLVNNVPYQETVLWNNVDYSKGHAHDFTKSYKYPWIQHSMVSIGVRSTSTSVLKDIAEEIIETSPQALVDIGAALCILGYQVLSKDLPNADDMMDIILKLENYVQNEPESPMHIRWFISCNFLLSQLHLKIGDIDKAVNCLNKCIDTDFMEFSPVLGTKVIQSAVSLGLIEFSRGNISNSRYWWKRALYECERAFKSQLNDWIQDIEEPLTFGLREASQILDITSQAAYALWITAIGKDIKVGTVHQIMEFTMGSQINTNKLLLKNFELQNHQLTGWIDELQEAKSWLEQKWTESNKSIELLQKNVLELRDWIQQLELGKQWIEDQNTKKDDLINHNQERIEELEKYIKNLEEARNWSGNKVTSLEMELASKEKIINELMSKLDSNH
ncbi:methyltransferase domain-containing protein [Paenibacillus sp. H1-7]|uniref:class I SAM-dependent methyltransferase n=1 Tax=Paenibacillus sp. H1-7 TaxID=2282849 RepID=UPI001EF7ADE2|nr:methyltransferase domain-containing protein [Paenibacillus sp. H1-7]ULL19035.1 methyltransferase domain-containing protein [Paenibacillus sp. H1-7]